MLHICVFIFVYIYYTIENTDKAYNVIIIINDVIKYII